MGQHLATLSLSLSLALGACSLIYNPNNLPDPRPEAGPDAPPPDAEIDAPIADADPGMIQIMSISPAKLHEGQGTGGSEKAVLVINGMHFLQGASVSVAPSTTPSQPVTITVDPTSVRVSETGNWISALVTADITALDEGEIDLIVTVTQPAPSQASTMHPWKLATYDELTDDDLDGNDSIATDQLKTRYSRVEITSGITFRNPAATTPAIVRAVADIAITGDVEASAPAVYSTASASLPGPGGQPGGGPGAAGSGPGRGGAGSNGATNGGGGGGAGFATAGSPGTNTGGGTQGNPSGDPLINGYDVNVASGGGGGGTGGVDAGGRGGGGGGTVELTAGGNVSVGGIRARGATGQAGSLGVGVGGGGGGGSGGVIVLRSGRTLTTGALDVGMGMGASPGGGAGAAGRIRFDTNMGGTMGNVGRRGPMIVRPALPITTENMPALMVLGTGSDEYDLLVRNATTMRLERTLTNGMDTVRPMLEIGYNEVCTILRGANIDEDLETKNCIDLVYIVPPM